MDYQVPMEVFSSRLPTNGKGISQCPSQALWGHSSVNKYQLNDFWRNELIAPETET